ncbi:MAG: helix-turn-helix transcriptional regulator [Fibrobacteres bacterium]|nr:helix-turn-helix transcriptional regulator [Fibrobacterota bacterium]
MEIKDILGLDIIISNKRTRYIGVSEVEDRSPDCLTLLFVTAGSVIVKINKQVVVAKKNDFLYWSWDKFEELKSDLAKPPSYYFISFRCLTASGVIVPPNDFLPVKFTIADPGPVLEIFSELFMLFNGTTTYRKLQSSILGLKLLHLISVNESAPVEKRLDAISNMDSRIHDVINQINNNIKKPHRSIHLAKSIRMHPVNFIALFKKETGMTPRQYVLERKIDKAKDFMTLHDDSPTSASLELGFHDYAHFYQTFKRLVGVSPMEYIKQYRKNITQDK